MAQAIIAAAAVAANTRFKSPLLGSLAQ
jgi:hypothetical protein